jgi:hypothetical protein
MRALLAMCEFALSLSCAACFFCIDWSLLLVGQHYRLRMIHDTHTLF